MAEYIKQKIQGGKKSICDSCTHRNVCKAIDNQPCTECNHYQCTADVEPVVRCRECKHCDPETHHCDHHMGTVAPLRRKPDDFCSYGERKEGDD